MERIMIADFDAENRKQLCGFLAGAHNIELAETGKEAVQVLDKYINELAVVMYRFNMPDMDGYEFLEEMNKRHMLDKVPVLFINERTRADLEHQPIKKGTYDFVHKPFVEEVVQRRINNFVDLFKLKDNLVAKIDTQNVTLSKQFRLLKIQSEELKKSKQSIVDILGTVVECRSLESGAHINRIKGYTNIIAKKMMEEYPDYGLNEHMVEVISSASALHDIGKIAIPDSILNKPGKLDADEFEFMKSHTIRGAEIAKSMQTGKLNNIWDEDYARVSYEICRSHHERYDGRGYPDGLKGDDIPISAQCESIADVYDALVTESVYKAAYSKEEAFNMIMQGECGVFSPRLLECFRKSREEFEAFLDANQEDSN